MASIPQITIRDTIAESFRDILKVNHYFTDIKKVFIGKHLSTEKFSSEDRAALVQVMLPGETYGSENTDGRGRTKSIRQDASLTVSLLISMKDATEEEFWCFIVDVLAAIAGCPSQLVVSDYTIGIDTIVEGVSIEQTSEKDELEVSTSPRIHEQIAEMILTVDYLFIPERLSGFIRD